MANAIERIGVCTIVLSSNVNAFVINAFAFAFERVYKCVRSRLHVRAIAFTRACERVRFMRYI